MADDFARIARNARVYQAERHRDNSEKAMNAAANMLAHQICKGPIPESCAQRAKLYRSSHEKYLKATLEFMKAGRLDTPRDS